MPPLREIPPPDIQAARDRVVAALKAALGQNLLACIEYGSTVRGGFVPGVSDLNLLLVLEASTPEAHAAISESIQGTVRVEPFVVARTGFARRAAAFAVKFRSIRRHYRVLHGEDLLKGLSIPRSVERFVCEQAVRNLHLRLVRTFIVLGRDPRRYTRYLRESVPAVFTDLSELLRQEGMAIPDDFAARIPLLEEHFGEDAKVIGELLALKRGGGDIPAGQIPGMHARILRLMGQAISWLEKTWVQEAPA